MTSNTMSGSDFARTFSKIHGASLSGEVKFRRKLSRQHFLDL